MTPHEELDLLYPSSHVDDDERHDLRRTLEWALVVLAVVVATLGASGVLMNATAELLDRVSTVVATAATR